MKTIYVVYYDWAFNDVIEEGYLGIYENLEDAIKRMEQHWEDEKTQDYFGKFNESECAKMHKSAWTDGYYMSERSCVRVYEETLYSHEDVLNGLDA